MVCNIFSEDDDQIDIFRLFFNILCENSEYIPKLQQLLKHSLIILQICCHEIIFEKIENAFGDDNDFLVFDGLRVKKFNRTT